MRKRKQTKRYITRAAALFLTAAMIVQAAAPALAASLDKEMVSVDRPVNQDDRDQKIGHTKATPSEATPSDTQKLPKATASDALPKNRNSILPNGSFEETSVTAAGWKWVWKNSTMPTGWGTWAATAGNQKIVYDIVTDEAEAQEGKNYLHIKSEDKTSRIDISYAIPTVDPAMNYLCTFWLKAENVEVTSSSTSGFYVRLARIKQSDGKTETNVETSPIKGTTDGWVQYSLMTKDLPSDNTKGLQIDIFSEYMSGDIWLDDIQIVPAYAISLDKKEAVMFTGETLQLEATLSEGIEEEIQWYSKNPEIADVDENGLVTAYKMGIAEIAAKTDDLHEAVWPI